MRNIFTVRRISQGIVVGLVLFLTIRHLRYGIEQAAPIDAYCPFGAVESFLTYVFTGEYLKRVYTSSFILFGIVLVSTIAFGRVFCSHLCPLGALQEWVRALGRKLGIRKDIELSKSVDRYARYLKYAILVAIVYFSYRTGDLVFRGYDPFNALMHLGNEVDEKIVGYSVLALVLFSSLFTKNWWGRYLCPLGATLGIVRRMSPFRIRRNERSCVGCGACDRSCPAGLDVSDVSEVNSSDCISCLQCVKTCPKGSLTATVFGRDISKKAFSLIIAMAFFVPLGIVVMTPIWQTKAPSNIVDAVGNINVADIRGSNTLNHVIEKTGVPLRVFRDELGLPEGVDTSLKLNEIGPKYDLKNAEGAVLETEDFRTVIDGYGKE